MSRRLLYHPQFKKEVNKLPKRIQEKLQKRLGLLKEDIFHPHLGTKPLHGRLAGHFSFRISREYRVIFRTTESDDIFLLKAGHRKDIYE